MSALCFPGTLDLCLPSLVPQALLCHNCGLCGDWGQEGEGSDFEQCLCIWPGSLLDLIRLLSLGWGLRKPSEAIFHLGRQNALLPLQWLFFDEIGWLTPLHSGMMAFLISAYAGAATCRSTYSCCPSHQAARQQCFSRYSSLSGPARPKAPASESSWHPLESLPAGSLRVAPAHSPGPGA